jgi:hypothetical protein
MIRSLVVAAALVAAFPALGADFGSLGALSQDEYHNLASDLGAAFSYKGVTPATPLGPVGFDVGVEVTDTRIAHSDALARAGAGDHSDVVIPKLHVYKGLFGGLDIGAFVAGSSELGASLFGADLRYALLDDTLATPAVAVRLSGTKATGLGDLSFATGALDLMVSKKFLALTPYAGAGAVYVRSSARGTALSDGAFATGRVFGGVNLNLVGVNLALEAENMAGSTSISAKLGLRF